MLVNRIATSGLVTLKLDELTPKLEAHPFDLADYLWQGLALREGDFRAAVRAYDWEACAGKRLCIYSSAEAIIPQWAHMLVASAAAPFAADIYVGRPELADGAAIAAAVRVLDVEPYRDRRVVVKGCSDDLEIGPEAYAAIAFRLHSVVKSLMYGEPCSTVPILKRK